MRMARVNVYLPDDLLASAKEADLPVSELTQAAVREALARRDRLEALERFIDDLAETQGQATAEEVAEAGAWAESVVAAVRTPRKRTRSKRAAS
jgi:post-segregation antitoxin (ccd killing protein)